MFLFRFKIPLWGLIFFAALGMIFLAKNLSAEEGCLISTSQDILSCALKRHPHVIQAEAGKLRDSKLPDIARQRPNPELQSRILGGQSADDTFLNTETSLLHTWELGDKRKARVGQANALMDKAGSDFQASQELAALQTVLALYRLREIHTEFARIHETVSTFDKILATFKSRPTLTPEQEVSSSSFQLAREEYKLKNTALLQEQSELRSFLEWATGLSALQLEKYFPGFKTDWPSVSPEQTAGDSSYSSLSKARAEQKLAQANVHIAKSKVWPDLKIGPTIDTESLNSGRTDLIAGIALSVPLPILNLNKGEKAYAHLDKLKAEKEFELTLQKISIERSKQITRYQSATRALQQSHSLRDLSAQHENMEAYFEKGLVPSTLVIECHRQLYEVTRTRHEQELAGIDALWRIYILDGKFLEQKI